MHSGTKKQLHYIKFINNIHFASKQSCRIFYDITVTYKSFLFSFSGDTTDPKPLRRRSSNLQDIQESGAGKVPPAGKDGRLTVDVSGSHGGSESSVAMGGGGADGDDGYIGSCPNTPMEVFLEGARGLTTRPSLASSTDDMGFTSSEEVLSSAAHSTTGATATTVRNLTGVS